MSDQNQIALETHLDLPITATSTSRSRRSAAGLIPTARSTKSPCGSASSAGGTDTWTQIMMSITKEEQKGFLFFDSPFHYLIFFILRIVVFKF